MSPNILTSFFNVFDFVSDLDLQKTSLRGHFEGELGTSSEISMVTGKSTLTSCKCGLA